MLVTLAQLVGCQIGYLTSIGCNRGVVSLNWVWPHTFIENILSLLLINVGQLSAADKGMNTLSTGHMPRSLSKSSRITDCGDVAGKLLF